MPAGLIRALEAEKRDLTERGRTIASEAEKAKQKEYTPEQLAELEEIEAKLNGEDGKGGINAQIKAEQRRMAWELDAPAVTDDDDDTPVAAKPNAKEGKGPFASLPEFLSAVKKAAYAQEKGNVAAIDPRLYETEAAITGASETVGQDGGFLVQTDIMNDLLTGMFEQANLAPRTTRFEVGQNKNGIKFNLVDETSRATGSRWGGVQVYWTAEGGTKTASKPKIRPFELTLAKLAGLLVATDELLEDTTSYSQFARMAFSEEMAFALDDAIVRGTGVGQPEGLLNAAALVSVSAEGGQAADSVVAENIWNMYARLPARSLARAEWFANAALIPQFAQLQLAVGTGGVPLYIPAGGIAQAPFGTLLGRPVNFIEQASAPGDVGDLILADLKEYILIEKGGIKEASSIHVYFDTDQTAFRWVWRVNGGPRWAAAITPYKGSPTISPFVALAAR